jgi:hypothetical protein
MRGIVVSLHHVDVPVLSPLAHMCKSMDGFPMQINSYKNGLRQVSFRACPFQSQSALVRA